MKSVEKAREYIDNHNTWEDGLPIFRRDLAELLSEFAEDQLKENTPSIEEVRHIRQLVLGDMLENPNSTTINESILEKLNLIIGLKNKSYV